jgi:hypothetical protein
MAYAGIDDVQLSLGRPLSDNETWRATGLLARVEGRIRARVGDLATQITADASLEAVLVEIEADAVARALRNPEGYRQEQDGDYMYIRGDAATSGSLDLTEDEWARLGITTNGFTITPYSEADGERTWVAPDVWL